MPHTGHLPGSEYVLAPSQPIEHLYFIKTSLFQDRVRSSLLSDTKDTFLIAQYTGIHITNTESLYTFHEAGQDIFVLYAYTQTTGLAIKSCRIYAILKHGTRRRTKAVESGIGRSKKNHQQDEAVREIDTGFPGCCENEPCGGQQYLRHFSCTRPGNSDQRQATRAVIR